MPSKIEKVLLAFVLVAALGIAAYYSYISTPEYRRELMYRNSRPGTGQANAKGKAGAARRGNRKTDGRESSRQANHPENIKSQSTTTARPAANGAATAKNDSMTAGGISTAPAAPNTSDSPPAPLHGRNRRSVKYRAHDTLPRGSVTGRVADENGAPVASASVALVTTGMRGRAAASGTTGEDGSYTLQPVRAGRYELVVSAPGHARAAEPVDVTPPSVRLDVTLDAGRRITGKAKAGNNGIVTVTASARAWKVQVETDASGAFTLEHVPRGQVKLTYTASGYAPLLRMLDASAADAGEVVLQRACIVNGSVTDAAGAPVKGARVAVVASGAPPAAAAAGNDGRFHITGVMPGTPLRLTASAPEYLPFPLELPPLEPGTEREVAVTLAPRAILRGIVQSGDAPVPNAIVEATPLRGGAKRTVVARTGGDGSFAVAVDGSTKERYELLVSAAGFAPKRLEMEGICETIAVELEAGCMLRGVVFSPDGAPLEAAGIRAARTDASGKPPLVPPQDYTDREGRFDLTGLGPGRWRVAVTHNIYAPQVFEVEFKAGADEMEKTITLETGWRFEGEVRDAGGKPLPDVHVEIVPADSLLPIMRFRTDSHGRFSAGGLGSTGCTLTLRKEGYARVSGVELSPGEPSRVFTLEKE